MNDKYIFKVIKHFHNRFFIIYLFHIFNLEQYHEYKTVNANIFLLFLESLKFPQLGIRGSAFFQNFWISGDCIVYNFKKQFQFNNSMKVRINCYNGENIK